MNVTDVVIHVWPQKNNTCVALGFVPEEDASGTYSSANSEGIVPHAEVPFLSSFIYVRLIKILMIPPHCKHSTVYVRLVPAS